MECTVGSWFIGNSPPQLFYLLLYCEVTGFSPCIGLRGFPPVLALGGSPCIGLRVFPLYWPYFGHIEGEDFSYFLEVLLLELFMLAA